MNNEIIDSESEDSASDPYANTGTGGFFTTLVLYSGLMLFINFVLTGTLAWAFLEIDNRKESPIFIGSLLIYSIAGCLGSFILGFRIDRGQNFKWPAVINVVCLTIPVLILLLLPPSPLLYWTCLTCLIIAYVVQATVPFYLLVRVWHHAGNKLVIRYVVMMSMNNIFFDLAIYFINQTGIPVISGQSNASGEFYVVVFGALLLLIFIMVQLLNVVPREFVTSRTPDISFFAPRLIFIFIAFGLVMLLAKFTEDGLGFSRFNGDHESFAMYLFRCDLPWLIINLVIILIFSIRQVHYHLLNGLALVMLAIVWFSTSLFVLSGNEETLMFFLQKSALALLWIGVFIWIVQATNLNQKGLLVGIMGLPGVFPIVLDVPSIKESLVENQIQILPIAGVFVLGAGAFSIIKYLRQNKLL